MPNGGEGNTTQVVERDDKTLPAAASDEFRDPLYSGNRLADASRLALDPYAIADTTPKQRTLNS